MRFLLTLLFCVTVLASTVDRLAISVGTTVITELQIDEDLRVAALLNGQPVARDAEARRNAADRLVEQLLIQHEMELSRYPTPTEQQIKMLYSAVEKEMGGTDHLNQLLESYHLTSETLRLHLGAQQATLRFIEFRFRPDVNIADSEIEAAYRRKVAVMNGTISNLNVPALDADQRQKLIEELMEERTEAALNSWLAESRKQISIVYIDKSLQ